MEQTDERAFYESAQKHERALMGAILMDNNLMDYALEHVEPRSFLIKRHRPIFAAMVEMYKRHQDIAPDGIIKEIHVRGDLASIGGEEYIYSLENDVPEVLTTERKDYVQRFALMAVSLSIQAAAFSEMTIDDIAEMAAEKFASIRELKHKQHLKTKSKRALPNPDGLSLN